MAQNDATTRFIGALNALGGAITRREVKDKEEEEKLEKVRLRISVLEDVITRYNDILSAKTFTTPDRLLQEDMFMAWRAVKNKHIDDAVAASEQRQSFPALIKVHETRIDEAFKHIQQLEQFVKRLEKEALVRELQSALAEANTDATGDGDDVQADPAASAK